MNRYNVRKTVSNYIHALQIKRENILSVVAFFSTVFFTFVSETLYGARALVAHFLKKLKTTFTRFKKCECT
jgi:hypothetical protein